MSLIPIERNPTQRQLTQFSLIWLVFFAVAGLIAGWKAGAWLLAATLLWLGLILPLLVLAGGFSIIRKVFIGLSLVTFPIGWALSWLILAFIYFLVVTPIALLLKLLGKDPMERAWNADGSYWTKREPHDDLSSYTRQF